MTDLPQPTALVTGAGGGIGGAIADRLAGDGFHVLALDREFPNREGASRRPEAVREYRVDLADSDALPEVIEGMVASVGRIDLLVNCAGLMRRGDALALGPDDWRDSFRVNTDAVFAMCRILLPHMARAGGGSIGNIASQWGLQPAAEHVAYNSSKAAVVALSRSLARDHGHQGIRVNAICPGEILTPMVEQKLNDSGTSEAEMAASIPIGRLGRPSDVAALVSFLGGEESSFISGAAIEITGAQVVP